MENHPPSGGNIRRSAWSGSGSEGSTPADPRRQRFADAREAFSSLKEEPDSEGLTAKEVNRQSIIDSAISGTKKTFVFGISLADFFQKNIRSIVGRTVHYFFDHKTEIIFGGLAGFAGKAALRAGLAGSGGWVATAAIGAAGGILSGGAKEYMRQSKEIPLTDEDRKLIIGFFINEYRKFPEIKKGAIVMAGLKGAVAGAAGGVIGAEIADNAWVQQQLAKIHFPSIGKPSVAAEATPGPTQTAVPTAEVTATPVPAATPETVPTRVSSAPEVTGSPPGPQTSVPETPPVKPVVSQAEVLPQVSDTLTIPQGSSIWTETKTYLEQNLGRPPTNIEIDNAVDKIMEDNRITDAGKVPAGASLNMEGVNEMIGKVAPVQIEISPELAKMPEVIPLPPGSNPWVEVSKYGASYLGRSLTDQETLIITRELAKQSGIAVPVWDLKTGLDHTKLPVGFKLIFNDPVKKLLEEMKK